MPRFWRRKSTSDGAQSPWFVKIKNGSPPPPAYTFQLEQPGIAILQDLEFESGDNFPAEQFWALRDLGFTYTLNDSDADFDTDEFRRENNVGDVESIIVETRIAFVKAVLANCDILDIESPLFYSILSSLENASKDDRFDVLKLISEGTPVNYGTVDGMIGFGYTSTIFGAIVCRAFNEHLAGFTDELAGEFELIASDEEYGYIILDYSTWDEIPMLKDFSLNLPQSYVTEGLQQNPPEKWERNILESIHESVFLGSAGKSGSTVGQLIFEGLDQSKPEDGDRAQRKMLLIVPQDTLADTEVDPVISSRI